MSRARCAAHESYRRTPAVVRWGQPFLPFFILVRCGASDAALLTIAHSVLPVAPPFLQGLTYFHETIYAGLPIFLLRIDTALANIGQPRLPLDATPFTFGCVSGGPGHAGGGTGSVAPMRALPPAVRQLRQAQGLGTRQLLSSAQAHALAVDR